MYKKFDIRKYSKGGAYRDDDYIFDKDGNFTGKVVKRNAPHRLGMPNKNGQMQYYEFADQVNDPKNVNKYESKAIPISKNTVEKWLGEQGALDEFNRRGRPKFNKYFWFGRNSLRNEDFDYTTQKLIPKYGNHLKGYDYEDYINEFGEEDFKKYPNKVKYADNVFFIPEGDGYAHNTFNFGNYLWGASGRALGFSESRLKQGANIHNKYNPNSGDFGNDDSPDDQFSISRGVKMTDRENLINKIWDRKSKKVVLKNRQ